MERLDATRNETKRRDTCLKLSSVSSTVKWKCLDATRNETKRNDAENDFEMKRNEEIRVLYYKRLLEIL